MSTPHGTTKSNGNEASEPKVQPVQKEVSYDGKNYDTIKEGLAEILIPRCASKASNGSGNGKSKLSRKEDKTRQTVFYNPIQQYNRDLSVLAIKAFSEDLAAIRLAKRTQREQNPKQAGSRGKKRKQGEGHDQNKKIKTGEDNTTTSATDASNKEEPAVGVPNDGTKHGQTRPKAEGRGVEELQENGESRDTSSEIVDKQDMEAQNSEADREASGEAINAPKGPKNKTDNFTPPFRILDALSASGLRALRYAKEIPMTTSVTANDLSSSAVESIKVNVAHNSLTSQIKVNIGDAIKHMHSTQIRTDGQMPQSYHVIDLDPYGTAAFFLDAAVQAITDGGLLCVTCTDAGVFASKGYCEKTYSQYGGLPLKGPHAHEAGLRLILHAIATSAARYGIAIEPLLSLSIDFYARVFVRVHHSAADVKFLASKTMAVYQCDSGCGSWTTQFLANAKSNENRNGQTFYKFTGALGPSAGKECEHCGFRTHLAGPMWGGPLHNPYFIQRILDMLPNLDRETYPTIPRIEGMLSLALDEDLDDAWTSAAPIKTQSSTNDPPEETPQPPAADATTTNDNTSHNAPSTTPSPSRPIPSLPPHYRTRYPFFIHPPSLARALSTNTPSDASLRGALRHLGYLTSRSHTKPGSIITNASFSVIWEIMREWVRQDKEKRSADQKPTLDSINPNTAAAGIFKNDRSRGTLQASKQELLQSIDRAKNAEDLKKELQAALYRLENPGNNDIPSSSTTAAATSATETKTALQPPQVPLSHLHQLEIRFDERLGKDPAPVGGQGGKKRIVRYPENPRENWGPLGRAKG